MKNTYLKLVLVVLLILFFSVNYSVGHTVKVNIDENNIKNHIDILTSEEYEGRLVGTKGNEKTLDYIENYFKSIGLKYLNEHSYKQEFNTVSFRWNGVPKFNVIKDNGDLVTSYEEGKDFLFKFDGISLGGGFKGSIAHVNDSKGIIESKDKYKNKAVLIDYEDININKLRLSEEQIDDRLYFLGKADSIIYLERNPINSRNINLGYKNTYIPEKGIIKIGVNKDVYDKLVEYSSNGYEIDLNIPVSFTEAKSSNIYGVIPGKAYPDGNYIIVGTSIDGLGINWDNKYYPGASDNAASISVMLELARIFGAKEKNIDSTIVFAGFNGKHIGSVGIQEYLRKPLIIPEKTEVIYLDKISTAQDKLLNIGTFSQPRNSRLVSKKVLNQFASISQQLEIEYNLDEKYLNSEYMRFRNYGIITTGLTYNSTHGIGTISDTSDNVNLFKAVEMTNLVKEYISYYGNNNLLIELSYILKSTWWLILIGIILIFIKNYKLNKWLNSKPIISIYLLVLLSSVVLTMQTKHSISESTGVLGQDINITAISLGYMLANNIFTTLPMLMYSIAAIVPIILIIALIYNFFPKINKKFYILIVSIVTYTIHIVSFNRIFDYRYSIIYPKLLSFHNSHYIIFLLILLFSLVVTWIFKKEMKKNNPMKYTIIFILVFFILTTFTYSPYVFNKEVINLKATGGILKL